MRDGRQLVLNVTAAGLAAATVALVFLATWFLFNRELALNNRDAVMLVLGVLLAKYSDLHAFFFGSSSQTKRQAETIDKLADTTAKAQEAANPSPAPAVTLAPGEKATVAAEGGNGTQGSP